MVQWYDHPQVDCILWYTRAYDTLLLKSQHVEKLESIGYGRCLRAG